MLSECSVCAATDMLEAMPGSKRLYESTVDVPYFSTSYQVSPAVPVRPYNGAHPERGKWYYTDEDNQVGMCTYDVLFMVYLLSSWCVYVCMCV